MKQGNLWMMMI